MTVYLNRISTAVPPNDVHQNFLRFAGSFLGERRERAVFDRMVSKSQIDHRWSVLTAPGDVESPKAADFYVVDDFPATGPRMEMYERTALPLALEAIEGLDLGDRARDVTHLIVVSCTGFSAPGLDLQIVQRCGLKPSTERTVIGFMGCYAAMNAMKAARHIVRSEPSAVVLIVCVELCTLHLQQPSDLEQVLSFMVFGDGCAAAIVSAEPTGLALDRFRTLLAPEAADQITWRIGDHGFEMYLSGRVPGSVGAALQSQRDLLLDGLAVDDIDHWAVHPGGRSVLDAVEHALDLNQGALGASREVLRQFGNMSSATILFVLDELMNHAPAGGRGCAMAFGPGLTAETLLFTAAGE